GSRLALKRFSLTVAFVASGNMLFMSLTGLDIRLFRGVMGASETVAMTAHAMFLASAAAPFLDAVQAYVRGVLTAHHLTVSRLVAVVAAAFFLMLVVVSGVMLHWTGPVMAGLAISSALTAELAALTAFWAYAQRNRMGVPTAL